MPPGSYDDRASPPGKCSPFVPASQPALLCGEKLSGQRPAKRSPAVIAALIHPRTFGRSRGFSSNTAATLFRKERAEPV